MTQVKTRPPGFVVMCSHPDKLPDSYSRYLINGLREDFDMPGTPIRLTMRGQGGDQNPPYKNKKKSTPSRLRKHLARAAQTRSDNKKEAVPIGAASFHLSPNIPGGVWGGLAPPNSAQFRYGSGSTEVVPSRTWKCRNAGEPARTSASLSPPRLTRSPFDTAMPSIFA